MKQAKGFEKKDALSQVRSSIEKKKQPNTVEQILNLPDLAPAPEGQESNVLFKKTL